MTPGKKGSVPRCTFPLHATHCAPSAPAGQVLFPTPLARLAFPPCHVRDTEGVTHRWVTHEPASLVATWPWHSRNKAPSIYARALTVLQQPPPPSLLWLLLCHPAGLYGLPPALLLLEPPPNHTSGLWDQPER